MMQNKMRIEYVRQVKFRIKKMILLRKKTVLQEDLSPLELKKINEIAFQNSLAHKTYGRIVPCFCFYLLLLSIFLYVKCTSIKHTIIIYTSLHVYILVWRFFLL